MPATKPVPVLPDDDEDLDWPDGPDAHVLGAGAQDPTADEIDDWANLSSEDDATPAATKPLLAKTAQEPHPPPRDRLNEPSLGPMSNIQMAEPAVPHAEVPVSPPSETQAELASIDATGDAGNIDASNAAAEAPPAPASPTASQQLHAASAAAPPPPPSMPEIVPASPVPPPKQTLRPGAAEDDDEPFGEDDLADSSAAQQAPHQVAKPAGGWGLGGWGLGALGGKLRQVAAGAVRDVQELSESFQQVCRSAWPGVHEAH